MQKRLGGAGGQEDENDDPGAAAAAGASKHGALEKYSGVKVKVGWGGGWVARGGHWVWRQGRGQGSVPA